MLYVIRSVPLSIGVVLYQRDTRSPILGGFPNQVLVLLLFAFIMLLAHGITQKDRKNMDSAFGGIELRHLSFSYSRAEDSEHDCKQSSLLVAVCQLGGQILQIAITLACCYVLLTIAHKVLPTKINRYLGLR